MDTTFVLQPRPYGWMATTLDPVPVRMRWTHEDVANSRDVDVTFLVGDVPVAVDTMTEDRARYLDSLPVFRGKHRVCVATHENDQALEVAFGVCINVQQEEREPWQSPDDAGADQSHSLLVLEYATIDPEHRPVGLHGADEVRWIAERVLAGDVEDVRRQAVEELLSGV